MGSNINDYQTPVPVEVGGVEVSRVILVSLQRGLGMFPMVLMNPESEDRVLSYFLWIPRNWYISWHKAIAQQILSEWGMREEIQSL